jgi:hypothetical protein
MKRYAIAVAALLLGTSALAWAPDGSKEGKPLAADTGQATMAGAQLKKADFDVIHDAKMDEQPAYAEQAAFGDVATPKRMLVSDESWQDETPPPDTSVPADASTPPADDSRWRADTTDTRAVTEPTPATPVTDTAMATDTTATQVASADLTPRPAATNYPACHPGPGDDDCIQLYERGVRTALASWDRPTGGFASEQAQAMAANSSPSDDATEVASADTDEGIMPAPGTGTTAAGAGDEVMAANAADTGTEVAANAPGYDPNSPYQGVGGPDEALTGDEAASATMQTGYPPCSRTVTDRCIQLYERGVTGEGN